MDEPEQTPCLTPEDMLCFDIYALNQAFGRVYKPILDPLGLTYPQYLVMTVLWDAAPLTVGRIAERLGLASSTLTPVLKRLEGRHLIARARSKNDERRVDVFLTDAGQALSDRAGDVSACVIAATGMESDALDQLRIDLGRLRDGLNATAS